MPGNDYSIFKPGQRTVFIPGLYYGRISETSGSQSLGGGSNRYGDFFCIWGI